MKEKLKAVTNFVWYEIAPSPFPVKCSKCGNFKKPEECVYITRDDGFSDIIIEKSCVTQEWLDKHTKAEPPKKRGAGKVWKTRPPRLKAVKPKVKKAKKSEQSTPP